MIASKVEASASTDFLIDLTIRIVKAYVSKNAIRPADIPDTVEYVYAALKSVRQGFEETPIGPPRGM